MGDQNIPEPARGPECVVGSGRTSLQDSNASNPRGARLLEEGTSSPGTVGLTDTDLEPRWSARVVVNGGMERNGQHTKR